MVARFTKGGVISVLAAFTICSPFACSLPATEHQAPKPSTAGSQGNLDDKEWKRFIDRQISAEAAGRRPPAQDRITWQEYWISWFDFIRISPGFPWKPSEFKTKQDMIRYIETQRGARRLPALRSGR